MRCADIKSYVHHSNIWNFADESVVSLKQMAASSLDALVYQRGYIELTSETTVGRRHASPTSQVNTWTHPAGGTSEAVAEAIDSDASP